MLSPSRFARLKRQPSERLIGVIDIGSNSVRLVVFKGLRRRPEIFFNEKVQCGLGRDLDETGRLSDEGMELALETLHRFAQLCEDMHVDEVDALATSAVRDASNGEAFVKTLKSTFGIKVKVLSGEEEAKLSAYGVASSFGVVSGLVGDLGGGSLELVGVKDGKVIESETLPLGTVRLLDGKDSKAEDLRQGVANALKQVSWLKKYSGQDIFLVGGAWRGLGKLHQDMVGWPLPVVQGYVIGHEMAQTFLTDMSGANPADILKTDRVSSSRRQHMPLAAMILSELMAASDAKDLQISAHGIREGHLYKKLNHNMRKRDPYIEDCNRLAALTGRFPEHDDNLMEWTAPLFDDETPKEKRMRKAACLMSDIGWRAHPDFRGESAFYEAFYGRFVGVSHSGRAFVALSLYVCYGGDVTDKFVGAAVGILTEKCVTRAKCLGLALRMGQRLTGGTVEPLKYSHLTIDGEVLALHLPTEQSHMAGSVVRKRLKALAAAFGKTPEIILK